jgi:hypothetical protein
VVRGFRSLLAGALVAVCVASSATAAGGPTGDPATIAFYRQVQSAYRTVHAIVGVRHGYFSYTVAGSVFSFRYGMARPAGLRPATESLLYLFRNGRATRFVDTARAAGLPPLTLIQDASGVWGRASSRPGGCYSKSPGAGNIGGIGQPFVGVFGDFQALRPSGKTVVVVTSTYPWGTAGPQAREVDRISAATKFLLSETVHVSGPAAFSFSLSGLRETRAPSHVPSTNPHC